MRSKVVRTLRGAQSPATDRVLRILDHMIDRKGEPVTISELVENLGMPRTTAYSFVRTLVAREYMERDPFSGKYSLGPRVHKLGLNYNRKVDVLRESEPLLDRLFAETQETVHLSVFEHRQVTVLYSKRSAYSTSSDVLMHFPVNWGASGRLLLSDWTDEDLRAHLPRMVEISPTRKAPTDTEILLAQIRESRLAGYAFQLNQASNHTGAVAAPVIDNAGRCVATISVIVPEERLTGARLNILIESVKKAAAEVSIKLSANMAPA